MIKKFKKLFRLEELENSLSERKEELERRESDLEEKERIADERFNKIMGINEGESSITFSFGTDVEAVGIETKINKEIVPKLIDHGVLIPELAEDDNAVQIAFVLLASEAAEQILMEATGNAD